MVNESEQIKQVSDLYLKKYPNTTLDELFTVMTLLHLVARPDMAGPNSHLELFKINKNGVYHSYNKPSRENKSSLLELLSAKYSGQAKKVYLRNIAQKLSLLTIKRWRVNQSMAEHINQIKEQIASVPELKNAYIKGENILQAGESVPIIDLSKIISNFEINSKSASESSYELLKAQDCIADSQSPNLKNDKQTILPHMMFALGNTDEILIGFLMQDLGKVNSWNKMPIFQSMTNNNYKIEVCFDTQNLLTLVYNGRAPHQLLKHILMNAKNQSLVISSNEALLAFPRWIEIDPPQRIIGEFSRAQRMSVEHFDQSIPTGQQDLPRFNDQVLGKVLMLETQNISSRKIFFEPRDQLYGPCHFNGSLQ
jgi:hypothetical protein